MTEKKKSSKNSDDSPLDYIKINRKNYIEELTQKEYITVTSNLLKSFSMIEDNIGAEINNIVVTTTPDGKQIFVRDIATLRDTIKDLSLDEKINGREGVRMMITKQSGANAVQICKDVRETLKEPDN